MNTPLNCCTCGAIFNQYNLKQKYCSAVCRNKALYANRKRQLAKAQQLPSITEQLARSQERVKELELQIKSLKQLEQENGEALRAALQQLAAQATPFLYHIELRKMSITEILDQPYADFHLDDHGNKVISIGSIYLNTYSNNRDLLSEQEVKRNDELLYLMEHNNITDIYLTPCKSPSLTRL
jgi:hypothetical protein